MTTYNLVRGLRGYDGGLSGAIRDQEITRKRGREKRLSGNCGKGKHSSCYNLNCSCTCHDAAQGTEFLQ